MCFFFKQSKKAVELEHRFNSKIASNFDFQANDNYIGFEFPKTPVITNDKQDEIQLFNWGLIPSWSKDENIRKYTLNARIETIKEKPSFKNSVNKRCLVLADGFYEWKWLDKKGKNKEKYLIELDKAFAFAGIWSEWTNKDTGEIQNSYSIITTQANKLMEEIHNTKKRMPVILKEEDEKLWLSNKDISFFKYPYSTELKAIRV